MHCSLKNNNLNLEGNESHKAKYNEISRHGVTKTALFQLIMFIQDVQELSRPVKMVWGRSVLPSHGGLGD